MTFGHPLGRPDGMALADTRSAETKMPRPPPARASATTLSVRERSTSERRAIGADPAFADGAALAGEASA